MQAIIRGGAQRRRKESRRYGLISLLGALLVAMLCGAAAYGQVGETWRRQASSTGGANLLDITMISAREGWAVGEQGLVLHTANGGLTWERQNSGTTEQLNAVHFANAERGWAVGRVAIHTTDGGQTWQPMQDVPNYTYQALDTLDGQTIFLVGLRSGEGGAPLLRSTDGGQTWETTLVPVTNGLHDIDMVTPMVGYIASHGLIRKTTDGGQTWLGVKSGETWLKLSFADAENGFAMGYDQHGVRQIWYTHDGGREWRRRDMRGALTVHAVSPQVAWVTGTDFSTNRAYAGLTTDGGEHYELETVSENLILYASFFQDANTAWVAGIKTDEGDGTRFGAIFRRGAVGGASGHRADFDGDGRADLAVFRPATGAWLARHSSNQTESNTQWGLAADRLVSADYDGDAKTDIAVFRDGDWYILQSGNNQLRALRFGQAGDLPVPADYDADGRADVAVFRPSSGAWHIERSQAGLTSMQFGQSGDLPLAEDFDGDGRADVGVYREGVWFMLQSRDGLGVQQFGLPADVPVAGDYDGDGRSDPAVFREGLWYLQQSRDGFRVVQFGLASDSPAPADYDGDGLTDVSVYRDGAWYLQQSAAGFMSAQYGQAGDRPVAAPRVP